MRFSNHVVKAMPARFLPGLVAGGLRSCVAALALLYLSPAWAQSYYSRPSYGCPPCNEYGPTGRSYGGNMVAPNAPEVIAPGTPSGPTSPSPSSPMGDQSAMQPGNPSTAPSATSPNLSNQLASSDSSFGTAAASNSGYSGMIGDLTSGLSNSSGQNVAIAAGDLRSKISENSSPVPTDRAFFNYNFFSKPLMGADGRTVDLNRFQFGVEKTFLDNSCSVELRVPFAAGLSANQFASALPDSRDVGTEFGNITVTPKFVVDCSDTFVLSAGLQIQAPTAADSVVRDGILGTTLVTYRNTSWHLEPFLGTLWTPSPEFFSIAYMQFDFDATGITTVDPILGTSVVQQQALMYLDINAGYWFYENPCAQYVRGIATVLELHYTTTLQDADRPVNSPFFGDPRGPDRRDLLDLTAGLDFKIGDHSILTVAGSAPLRGGDNRPFAGEFILQYNFIR